MITRIEYQSKDGRKWAAATRYQGGIAVEVSPEWRVIKRTRSWKVAQALARQWVSR